MQLLGGFRATLGTKLLFLLVGTAIVPAALLALLSLAVIYQVGELAVAEGGRALTDQALAQLEQLAVETARRDEVIFERARSDAVAVAAYAAYLYDNPHLFRYDPYWDARQRLVRGTGGELLAMLGERFGTFVPASVPLDDALVEELNLLAHLDFVFEPLRRSASYQSAAYVATASRTARVYPRLDVSRPDDDPMRWSAAVAAGPGRNPRREAVWTAPHLDDLTGSEPVLSAGAPIYTRAGDFKGVAAVDVPLFQVVESALAAEVGREGHAFLIDSQGRLVAASDETVAALGLPPRQEPLAETLAPDLRSSSYPAVWLALPALTGGTSGVTELDLDDRQVLLAYAPVRSTGWVLALLRPRAVAVQAAVDTAAQIRDSQAAYLQSLQLLTAIVLAGVAVAALLAARAFSRPIRLLTLSTRRIAAGDLSHRAPVLSDDEVGVLAAEFNLMARNLAELNAGLESKVADRTRQLLRRADQLRTINQIGQRVTSILALEDLLPSVAQTVFAAFRCYSVAIFLREGDALRLRALAATATGAPEVGTIWPAESIIGWVVEHGEPVLANDVLREPRYRPAAGLEQARAELVVPIAIGPAAIGALSVQHAEPNAFDDDDPAILRAIADQIAVAMENARLFAESRGRATLEERNRLAREMHDGLAQQLTGIVLQLEASDQLFEPKPERAQARLRKALELARDALSEARRSVWNLRSAPLEAGTLTEAIQGEIRRLHEESGIAVDLDADGVRRLPPEAESCLFRVAQEALNNVRKHARASHVAVELEGGADWVRLTVRDDGVGFDSAARPDGTEKRRGFGLVGLRERAQLVGGNLNVSSAPGHGTELTVTVPIDPKEVRWIPSAS
ncbi:MAG: GAF domain-containing protein [Chloroflexi bacterium]|nr:GAF domain-containing protein [Chloroflexota bacterium]